MRVEAQGTVVESTTRLTANDSLTAVVAARIRHLQASRSEPEDACSTEHRPLSESELRALEHRLGHALPPSVKELYSSIGNGGFGPAYGLLGLHGGMTQEDGNDAFAQYQLCRRTDAQDPHWRWPEGLLPLVHLGCAMFFCVDCTTPDGSIVWFEPNPHVAGEPWTDSFIPLGMNFETLMRAWADGRDVMEMMESAWKRDEGE